MVRPIILYLLTNMVQGTMFAFAPRPEGRALEFVYTALFERTRKSLLTDEDMKRVEDELLGDPERGVLMSGTGGIRKLRAAQENRGKRGSARVAYLYLEERETVYFLIAFGKNVQANLTAAECRMLRQLVAMIRSEQWPTAN
jgi:hypothetical protein